MLIMADDHRHESIAANGCEQLSTPHLDGLIASGVSFDGAHCQGGMHPAVCVPSRASLLTGRNVFASSQDPSGKDYEGAAFAIPADMKTVPEMLRAAGYVTHHVGKWHNDRAAFARSYSSCERVMFGGMSDHDKVPLHRFDPEGAYAPEDCYYETGHSTDLFGESAVRFLQAQDKATPFFLKVAFTAPHDPRTPPPEHSVAADTIDLPANYLPVHPFDNGELLVRDELLEKTPRSPDAVRQHIADYYGMVQQLDAAIGDILAALEQRGLREDTLVIYTADHGIGLGQHGLMGKQNLYEHSTRIPLILSGAGLDAGRRVDHLVWHADTTATILECAGLDPHMAQEGQSLVPLANGQDDAPLRDSFCAVYAMSQRMVRDARWKLIQYHPQPDSPMQSVPGAGSSRGSETEQLFDLEADPFETVNLSSSPAHQDIRARLLAELRTWQREAGDPLA
ncbi:sulfatase-like hydrolase/transferase [Oceaniglobus trochenteri]|uniref:sulfatase-like hydrolase/transferase n=1 Tax=Oceaniglobus trochenteri TaxID=2763260 RepID=UPI001D000906